MSEDEKVYNQAMERMDELVDEVIQTCIDVADENHYEREWVLDRFRAKFSSAKRKERSEWNGCKPSKKGISICHNVFK